MPQRPVPPAPPRVLVREDEVEVSAIRAQGPGGQNVNKVSTAVQLRYDIRAASLPEALKEALLALPGRRVSKEGVLVLKAQGARSQEQNRTAALARLQQIVDDASVVQAPRRPTRPTWGSTQRRLQGKAQRAGIKAGRRRVDE